MVSMNSIGTIFLILKHKNEYNLRGKKWNLRSPFYGN